MMLRISFSLFVMFAFLNQIHSQEIREKLIPKIVIDSISVGNNNNNKLRIEIAAKGINGINVGSYVICVEDILPHQDSIKLTGFKRINNLIYAISSDFNSFNQVLLKDNGILDEDKRINVFAITFNTSNWPSGRYYMNISAVNRPSAGAYVFDTRYFTIDIGNAGMRFLKECNVLQGIENITVWEKKGVYAYFPSLMKLQDDTLVTHFEIKNMQSHIDNTSSSYVTMFSIDKGRTWNLTSNKFNRNLQYSDGKFNQVIVSGWKYTSDSLRNKYEKKNYKTMDVKPGTIAYLSKEILLKKSIDSGRTWTVKSLNVPDDVLGLHKFGELRLNTGLWIITLYGPRKQAKQKSPKTEAYILRSIDNGDNWEFVYITPKGIDFEMNETSIISVTNQNLIAVSRSSDNLNMLSSLSSDGGKSWSKPRDTGIEGYPPDLILLPDGRIVCVYGYRKIPMGIRGCISYDNGITWDTKNEFIIRDDGLGAAMNIGYPKIVQLNDGSLFTIYYISTDGTTPYIAGSHFILPSKK